MATPWFAIRVRSNFEKKASSLVAGRTGCPVFYPTYTVRSTRRGLEHEIEKPLFAGYFFVQKDLVHESKNDVLGAAGVVEVVSTGGRPIEVPGDVIESLTILDARRDLVRPHPFLREGMTVAVRSGPFAGARGIIVQGRGKKPKLVVSMQILGRSVGVLIDPRDVEPDL
jgi:transcriptional antiterminator RfaH